MPLLCSLALLAGLSLVAWLIVAAQTAALEAELADYPANDNEA